VTRLNSRRPAESFEMRVFRQDNQQPLPEPVGHTKLVPVSDWDPNLYLRFEGYRARAGRDLLARVEPQEVQSAVDLGCGPGNSTRLLADRWPRADITGVDNSAAMLERAQATYPNMSWIQADIARWRPPAPQDLIFANASLQWVSNHADLLQGLCSCLRPGGTIAFQIPSIHQQPAAEVYRRLIMSPRWRAFSDPEQGLTVETPAFYYDVLAKYCRQVEIWETVYHHLLEKHEEMVTWYRSTGLRPFLTKLPNDHARSIFMVELADCYRQQFPPLADQRILFPFHRLFVLATAK
jgi:trans-aconitate 2-methyltransferase